jgi:hypothetical protein
LLLGGQRMYERQRFQLNWPLSLICNRPTSLMGKLRIEF